MSNHLEAASQVQLSRFLPNDYDNNEIQDTENDLLALYTELTFNDKNEPRAISRCNSAASHITVSNNSNRASRLRLAAIRARINANSNPRRPRANAKTKSRRPHSSAWPK